MRKAFEYKYTMDSLNGGRSGRREDGEDGKMSAVRICKTTTYIHGSREDMSGTG